MKTRTAEEWIQHYDLKPHPFGCGYFKEMFRSDIKVKISKIEGEERNLSTGIISLFKSDQITYLHKTKSHQDIHFYVGNTNLLIHFINPSSKIKETIILGSSADVLFSIPAETWFAFELQDKSKNCFALTGHTVTPGFDFRDFKLANRNLLTKEFPMLKSFIYKFTMIPPELSLQNENSQSENKKLICK